MTHARVYVWVSEKLRGADLSCQAFQCFLLWIFITMSLFRVRVLMAYLANNLRLWRKQYIWWIYSVQCLLGAVWGNERRQTEWNRQLVFSIDLSTGEFGQNQNTQCTPRNVQCYLCCTTKKLSKHLSIFIFLCTCFACFFH